MDVPVKDKKSWQLTTASISLHGVGTGCENTGCKKHGSISTGTWLAFATTWIGGLPDLIGEVKLSAFISYKFVAIGGQGWWSILGNSHGEERIY